MMFSASSDFLSELLSNVRQSLIDTLSVFSPGERDLMQWLGMALSQLLIACVLLVIFGLAYLLLSRVLRLVLARTSPGPELQRGLWFVLRFMVLLMATLAVLAQFSVPQDMLGALARASLAALFFFTLWLLANRLLAQLLKRYDLERSIEQLLRNVVLIFLVAFGIVTVLAQFGFDIVSVVAGLGIVGLAVGFAAQSTLSNFIAGITILVERPFRIGDWVRINDKEGKVMQIALRTTRLRTRDNIYTILPNDSVASAEIVNLSAGGPLRVRVPLGIAYKESAKAARQALLPVLESHEHILKAEGMMPAVSMTELGDSSVNLVMLYWIDPEQIDGQPRISAQVLEASKEALDAAGIEIPFPHLQLFIDDAKGLKPLVEPLYRAPETPTR